MRRITLLFLVIATLVGAGTSFAQEPKSHEAIVWARGTSVFPWYFYTGEKFTGEIRYAIDEDKTMTGCLGKSFGGDAFSVIPEACAYVGESMGYGPELWILSETKKYSVTSYIQYGRFQDTESFGYAWFQGERNLGKGFGLGVGAQVTKVSGFKTEVDFGTSLKFQVGNFIFNALPMWRTTKEDRGKLSVSSGVIFEF